jgi:hypothetical protein
MGMDIQKINTRHKAKIDTQYRAIHGVSSSIISFQNQVMILQAVITKPKKKSYNGLAVDVAHLWKNANEELGSALACKVYFIDLFANPHRVRKSISSEDYDAKKGIIFYRQYLN